MLDQSEEVTSVLVVRYSKLVMHVYSRDGATFVLAQFASSPGWFEFLLPL